MSAKSTTTTEFLLNQIAAGNHGAFRVFYERYYLQVYRFTSYFILSPQLIEEVVSDIFCIIWQNRKRLATIENFESYLYTITKHKAFYYLKKEKQHRWTELETISETLQEHINPEYLTLDEELNTSFKKAIDELPERCRTIFLMAREEGLKYKEIADILSISEKTVNAQMVLAIKKLSQKLGNIITYLF